MTNTTLTLVGGPTAVLDYAGARFLTDPTFDGPGDYPSPGVVLHKLTGPALGPERLGGIDAVLLSHDQHADNLDRSGRELLGRVPVVLSTPEAADRIPGVVGLAPWQEHRVGDVEVVALPALHGPDGEETEGLSGTVTGFLLRAPGHPVVYVSGDNASVTVVEEIAARVGRIDVAILFAGAANVGRFGDADLTLNARTAVQAARILGDAVVVPIHAEGWHHFSEDLARLAREFEYSGLSARLRVPRAGDPLEL
ncbi:L-ascorbate metabolism protein UlaG (beta-lactamase superfamily) [Microbacterium resistens]|uniref:L-ascorbate metabolism protein UlaG (Beta-lactamase superfamily) n=1 Tax=Microbacterium resistens TaxID=156977 RepID=A0ABU1SEQ9_9MICO|nr:MBL fold metallo-hydrolase [Microbacterium resistens]MDR6868074.1 L-ascorbate metabolism protein UlaG (beta-lactamase superfamily) [Microbacterium resistens]